MFFVDTADFNRRVVWNVNFQIFWLFHFNWVGVTNSQDQLATLGLSTVTNTDQLQSLLKPVNDTFDHVVNIGTRSTVDHLSLLVVIFPFKRYFAVSNVHLDQWGDFATQSTLRPLNSYDVA